MKNFITLLIFGLLSLPMFSQANNSAYNMHSRAIYLDQEARSFGLTEAQFKDIDGSPYANKTFLPGTIFKGTEVAQPNVQLRYNIHADEIEIKSMKDGKEAYSALLKNPELSVKILNDYYIFVPFAGSVEKGGYFNIVSEGEPYDLYKKSTATYSPPVTARTSYERDQRATFTIDDTYYLVSKIGDLFELPDSKSKILKVMDKKKSEIKAYIKDQDLDLDEEADLEKLVKYFNSLL